jgi:hypothetical protein
MGGKGRGVFSDFRLGRVRGRTCNEKYPRSNFVTVSVQDQCVGRQSAWREEGQLVDLSGFMEWNCVYYDATDGHWAALLQDLYIRQKYHGKSKNISG